MAIKKQKKFVNRNNTNDFVEPGPISSGNTYDTYLTTKTQDEINKENLIPSDVSIISKDIINSSSNAVKEHVPNWWVLLQEQGNYFCNQLNWTHDDYHIKSLIINTIRGAFYSGISGIYYNDITGDFESVIVSNIKYNASSRIESCKYSLSHNYLNGIKDNIDGNNDKALFDISKDKIDNLAIFKWGTEAFNAWIRILPYVKNQHVLMKMLAVQKYAYNKKFVYTCNSPTAAKKEIELFFNPENLFIVNAGFGKTHKELENEFGQVNLETKSALEFVNFYKESMSIIYSQIGRRENVDTKKERNVSSEVEASQENYDILFKDVYNQFEIFSIKVNELFNKYGVSELKLFENKEPIEQEQEQGENENDVPDNIS